MKSKASLVFVVLAFFVLSGTTNAQQSNTPRVTDNPQQEEDQGGDPVDSTGRAHYQQGSLGYMAGKEHYIQGKLGYSAGKEHYQSKVSPSVSVGSQGLKADQPSIGGAVKATRAAVEEGLKGSFLIK
jgi:hypothetical protein